ncbi:MAG TPA: hypothetical protein VFE12_22460 [Acetobacteraceae bacterium]|jgi:hypothetical protein|nr:hypothetical protein [Acetobacteraceae bacterium]
MRTMLLAAAAALSLSAGSAFADGEGGPSDTAFFNRQVLAQAPSYRPAAVAGNQATGAPTAAFVTGHSSGTWLFPPADSNG